MTADPNEELAGFRRQIDELDDKLIALLIERTGIVARVGEFKRRNYPGQCPLRAGREADMVRRIYKAFSGTLFLPEAAAAIWRTIIGMSTAVESPMRLSVFTPERESDLYWLAREYFGSFLPVIRQPHIKRVIGDVVDGKAAIGIVPMLRSSDTTYWWTNLMEPGPHIPKIFARIPFVSDEVPGRDQPSALALGVVPPEPSESDLTLLVLEADANASQNRLQTAFAVAGLEATWINVATLSPSSRHHLIEVKGFVTLEHPALQSLLAHLGASVFNACFLGAYAVPIMQAPRNT